MTPLLDIRELAVAYPARYGWLGVGRHSVRAVEGVSFQVHRGETLGVVGESGCGKSTLAKAILRLIEPASGSIRFDGQELVGLSQRTLRPLRRRMQPIFQDPVGSLDPRMTVEQIVGEGLRIHRLAEGPGLRKKVEEVLERVGLTADALTRRPHEFSGGQRQRIGIARALAVGPELIVADEPTSALDASVQAQIASLLLELRRDLGLTYVFIAHDLRLVRHVSTHVAVMYAGRLVELAPTEALFQRPRHPYTQALLAAVPAIDSEDPPALLPGEAPPLSDRPLGCAFHPRCLRAIERCRSESPALEDRGGGHRAACFLAEEGTG